MAAVTEPRLILGAVLAGGMSRRFGTDKALAQLDGRSLLSRAVEQLEGLCDSVVVVGRETAPARTLPDWPAPNMGPLGGLAAALNHAEDMGYDAVLTCAVDSLGLPDDLVARLSPAPRFVGAQPVIGLWPCEAAAPLRALLEGDGRHSMLAFAEAIGADAVALPRDPANLNTPDDLTALERGDG